MFLFIKAIEIYERTSHKGNTIKKNHNSKALWLKENIGCIILNHKMSLTRGISGVQLYGVCANNNPVTTQELSI